MDVFLSYARADANTARQLADDIEAGGHRVWFDRDLHGGEDWWGRILERIRACSVVVFALSEDSLRSQACRSELNYAHALGVPVIPAQIGPVASLLTTAVSHYQVIDYQRWSSNSGIRLMSAIVENAAQRGPLPEPLPPTPPVPFAYLLAIAQRIAEPTLRSAEQASLIGQLRHALRDEDDDRARADSRRLLLELRRHPECTHLNVQEIDAVLDGDAAGSSTTADKRGRRLAPVFRLLRRPAAAVTAVLALVVVLVIGVVVWVVPGPEPVALSYSVPPAVAGPPVVVGKGPRGVVFSPDRRHAFVANSSSDSVSVIDTVTGAVTGPAITVGHSPEGIAVSPDGRRVYVANAGPNSVSVIDTATGAVPGSPITVGTSPLGIAVSPDGRRVYTANSGQSSVSVIDTETGGLVGSSISVGREPFGVAAGRDGRVYVANSGSNSVTVIDAATGAAIDPPLTVGDGPRGVAVSPDGERVYVANSKSGSVSVIDTATRRVVDPPVTVGGSPWGVAVSPDNRRVYVTDNDSGRVSVIDTGLR